MEVFAAAGQEREGGAHRKRGTEVREVEDTAVDKSRRTRLEEIQPVVTFPLYHANRASQSDCPGSQCACAAHVHVSNLKVRTAGSRSAEAHPCFTIQLVHGWKAVMTMILTYKINDNAVQLCVVQDIIALGHGSIPLQLSCQMRALGVFRRELCMFECQYV